MLNKYWQYLLAIVITSSLFFSTLALSANQQDIEKFRTTCQCPGCDLKKSDWQGFYPAKELINRTDDPFANCKPACTLANANLSEANFSNVYFGTCYLNVPNDTLYVDSLSFKAANLTRANFYQANLHGVIFDNANLTHANLKKADITQASFYQANLSYANLDNTVANHDNMAASCADFTQANFRHAQVRNAKLCGLFQETDFSFANLTGTILEFSVDSQTISSRPGFVPDGGMLNAPFINFTGANLTNAQFQFHDMFVPGNAFIYCHTTMPNGSINNRDCKKNQ